MTKKTVSDLKEYIDSLFDLQIKLLETPLTLEEKPIKYHTCEQVLENNILIWKLTDRWHMADNHRNDYHDFPYHPKIIKSCEYCNEVLK